MRWLVCALLPMFVYLAGCGPSASIQRLSSDTSGQDPILQVWTKAGGFEAGADIKVLVGWNKHLGTGPVSPTDPRSDGMCVVKVSDWKPNASDYDHSNDMRIEFIYNGQLLAKKVLPTPTDFANAYYRKEHPEVRETREIKETKETNVECPTCGDKVSPGAKSCPSCGVKLVR